MLAPGKVAKAQFATWATLCEGQISKAFGSDSAHLYQFSSAGQSSGMIYVGEYTEADFDTERYDELKGKISALEAIISAAEFLQTEAKSQTAPTLARSTPNSREVFVVHGHDDAAKTRVARFLERLDLVPVVLHEQLDRGQTIIEKFEKHAMTVSFAVILLTPDDNGGARGAAEMSPRARQNVILEMGYFVGKLGRSRVCALHVETVEIPSDLLGVLYTPLDPAGAWETKLAKEMRAAGLPVDMNRL